MKITEQDKRDIQETMKWLDEACYYLMEEKIDMENGQWLENVKNATDVAEIWLTRIIQEMNQLQKLKKEIQSTLDQEKSNIFGGHHDESNLKGWIEALEYCKEQIELLEEK